MIKITAKKASTLISLFLLLTTSSAAFAATTPSFGAVSGYGVLSSTYTNTSPTTINGSVGFTTGPAVTPSGTHTNYGSAAPYGSAGTDQGVLLNALNVQPCTFTFAPGAIDLSTDITHGAIASYAPGVYCSSGAMSVSGPLTLSGSGTYIFRPVGAFTTAAGTNISASGANACDVFWTPSGASTLGANTTFFGNIIDNAGITVGANTTWTGSALAFGGTVTTNTSTITPAICGTPVVIPAPVTIVATTTPVTIVATTTPVTIVATTTPVVVTPVVISTPVATNTPVLVVTPVVPVPVVIVPAVTYPTLPNTGIEPQNKNTLLVVSLLVVLISATGLLFISSRKKTAL